MNRRRFISTAVRIAAVLPVFGPLLRGQSEKAIGIMTTAEIRDRLGLPPPIVVSGWINSIDVLGDDGNWLPVMSKARARCIADEHLERYAHPVVTFEIHGQAVNEELLAELEAKAR